MDHSDILTSLKSRNRRWGIRRASDYVSGFAGCLGDGFCPTSLMNVPADQWQRCLKEAESRLTYANERMVTKAIEEKEIPTDGIMAFNAVITTTKRDRDGDVLESSGATLDMKMPLLWQHLPLQPIGKFVKEVGRTKRYVAGQFAIADLPLGRDAATLVKFGALRISHGFHPDEFDPLEDEKGEQIGWHIRKYGIMETSLVSIPSNTESEILTSVAKSKAFAQELDGIRTAYGRNLLETDLIKRWAKHFHDHRPTKVRGLELPYQATTTSTFTEYDAAQFETKQTPCACQASKAALDLVLAKNFGIQPKDTYSGSCTCPECGHNGPMSEFTSVDEEKAVRSLESRCFATLIQDLPRMRAFRDRLSTVLEAHLSPRERTKDSGLDDLLGIAVSAARN